MSEEIKIKDVYDLVGGLRTEFLGRQDKTDEKIQRLDDRFTNFEEGKLSQVRQDMAGAQAKIKALEDQLKKDDGGKEKRKDWMWGAVEKILFTVIGTLLFLAGLVLTKLGIINLGA